MSQSPAYDNNAIKLLILDVDGVMTDGTIGFTPDGKEYKFFNTQDGLGIKRLQQHGIAVAIISGRSSDIVSYRAQELGIKHVFQGQQNKLAALQALQDQLNIEPRQIAHMGDDLPDLEIMKKVGLGIAVANAVDDVKAIADWHTTRSGGAGAVREACDLILKKQGKII